MRGRVANVTGGGRRGAPAGTTFTMTGGRNRRARGARARSSGT